MNFDRFRPRLPANATLRHIAVLAGGTAGAQLIVLLASPLLTRLYTPEQFGFLAVFSALMNTLMVVASLRYQAAVPLARDDRAGVATAKLCVYIGIVVAIAMLVLVALVGEQPSNLVNASGYAAWLYLLPVAILVAGWFEVFRAWSVRKRTFSVIAAARVQQSVAMTVVQLVGFRFGVAALVVGQVMGRSAGLGRLFRAFQSNTNVRFDQVRRTELVEQARVFRRFPIHSTWGTLLNTTGRQMPAVFFAALADPAVAGLFALAQRVLAAPLTMISDSISGVFMSVGVRANAAGSLRSAVETFNGALCLLMAIPLLAVMLLGPEAFSLVFGSEWTEAGLYAAWMAPWIYTVLVSTSLMAVYSITGKDSELSLFQLGLTTARVLALVGGWWLGSALHAIALFSLVSCLAYILMTMRLHVLAGGTVGGALRPVVVSFAWAAAVLSPIELSLWRTGEPRLAMIALSAVLAAVYYAWQIRRLLRQSSPSSLRPANASLSETDAPPRSRDRH